VKHAKSSRSTSAWWWFLALGVVLFAPVGWGRAAESVWLSSLDLTKMSAGWGKPLVDRSVTGQPLGIAGQSFAHGVGTHAPSVLWIELGGGAERFVASVGMDDAVLNQPGSVIFKVYGDDRLLWRSEVLRPGQPAQPVDLEVKGRERLVLVVSDAGDGASYDHADWADARFVVGGKAPRALEVPREEAVILTPPPPPTPRINGARVFGVRPGSPFLFTIPATGDRPMRFGVEDLPAGLALDGVTGQISGRLDRRGVYPVMLVASNRLGVARRPFQIVCGETLALTPHMGWNSWYVWENHVTDRIMRQAADAMVQSGLIQHGYMYVNIDDCWAVKPGASDPTLQGEPRDSQGKVNANRRFPDMKGLTDYIHAQGLKAGIYTSPGPTTCAGHVGAYGHEEQDVARFAEWGFDFLKYDWCSYGNLVQSNTLPELLRPYRQVAELLRRQPRDIVLNLCQYGLGNVWEWGQAVGGHSWRTAGDLGGSFEGIATALFRDGFDVYARRELHRYGQPGGWNDPDYLLLGYLSNWRGQTVPTPLTPNEQYSHVSLWCLVAAPLILSGDITRLDPFTLGLLSNDEVLEVDQDPLGKPGRRISAAGDLEVWGRELVDGSRAVGLFNRGEVPAEVAARWADLGLPGRCRVRDLWRQKDLGTFSRQYAVPVPRHGVVLIRVFPARVRERG
jgi:alpha-galactosidase